MYAIRSYYDSPEIDWPQIVRLVLTSRLMDDLEENEFVPGGKIKYQFSAKGHELAQVLLSQHSYNFV